MADEPRDLLDIDRELMAGWVGLPPAGFQPFQALRDVVVSRLAALPELSDLDRLNTLMLLVYRTLLGKHGFEPRGIVHVGAHTGSELPLYLLAAFRRVLLLEPHPDVQPRLQRRVAAYNDVARDLARLTEAQLDARSAWAEPWCRHVACAAGAEEGQARLHCTHESTLSSLLEPRAEAVHDGGRVIASVPVPLRRLDALLDELPGTWRAGDLNVAWINVQGAELDVLRGAPRLLDRAELVTVELNYDGRYSGESAPADVDARLRAHGLVPTFGLGVPEGGMRFYARADAPGQRYQSVEGDR
jgi:FkbM family methyltransferase